MRIATWNLNSRWSSEHAAFLRDQAADIWCLTEVAPPAIDDGQIAGYPAVTSTGRMLRGQFYAVVAARLTPTAARFPHPATVVAMGLVAATPALPHQKSGLFTIDHIAVPVS